MTGVNFYLMYWRISVLLLLVFVSCTHRVQPVIPERERPVVQKKAVPAPLGDAVKGAAVFTARCGRCHGLPDPDLYTEKRWETILASMSRKARLDAGQDADLRAWIAEQVKKG